MAKHVFPSENSVGTLFGEPSRDARERSAAEWMKIRGSCHFDNFVYSGYLLSDPNSGLVVTVALGVGMINGFRIENDAAENLGSLTDANTNYIYAQLTKDGNNLVTGYQLVSNTTGTAPADAVLLGIAVTTGGQVTSVTSVQWPRSGAIANTYTGDNGANRLIWLGWQPKFVVVKGRNHSSNATDSYAFSSPGVTGSSPEGLGVAEDLTPATLPVILADSRFRPELASFGFIVHFASSIGMNVSGETYAYTAWA